MDNDPYSIDIGNDYNFNYIGSKNNNLVKIEKLFNNKLIDINKNMNEFVEKYKEPNINYNISILSKACKEDEWLDSFFNQGYLDIFKNLMVF